MNHKKDVSGGGTGGTAIHDHTFKQLLSHREFFMAFCHHYLPPDLLKKIDFEHCELFKLNSETIHASQHTRKIQKKIIADLIYQVRLKQQTEQEGLILIHSEHDSRPDRAAEHAR